MIRTSLHGRSARGRAAETAARPPTRTKSSISVVTNRTFKNALVPAQNNANATTYARKGPVKSARMRVPDRPLEHDPRANAFRVCREGKVGTGFPSRQTSRRLRGDHAQTKR